MKKDHEREVLRILWNLFDLGKGTVERLDPAKRLSPHERVIMSDELLLAMKTLSVGALREKDLTAEMRERLLLFLGRDQAMNWSIIPDSDFDPDDPEATFGRGPSVPAGAEKLLFLGLSKSEREEQIGDLEEEFRTKIVPRFGLQFARRWYWSQVSRTVAWAVVRRIAATVDWIFRLRRS